MGGAVFLNRILCNCEDGLSPALNALRSVFALLTRCVVFVSYSDDRPACLSY